MSRSRGFASIVRVLRNYYWTIILGLLAVPFAIASPTFAQAPPSQAVSFAGMSMNMQDLVTSAMNFFNLLVPVIMLIGGIAVGAFIVRTVINVLR